MKRYSSTSHYSQRVRDGVYIARRARQAGLDAQAAEILKETEAVREAGRVVENAETPVQEASAMRDASDDALDATVRTVHANLAGRSARAKYERPFTSIFAKGLEYFVDAPLNLIEPRTKEFQQLLVDNLTESDPVRCEFPSRIDTHLTAFIENSQLLSQARADKAAATARLDTAEDAFDRRMERFHGFLIEKYGKKQARAFFPRANRRRPVEVEASEEETAE